MGAFINKLFLIRVMANQDTKRIYRSRQDKVIGGVCGGIAEYFNIDPVWIRIIAVVLALMDGIGILAYIVAWIIIPENSRQKIRDPKMQSQINSTIKKISNSSRKNRASFIIGAILVAVGFSFLFNELFFWFSFKYVWPLIIIALGIFLIIKVKK